MKNFTVAIFSFCCFVALSFGQDHKGKGTIEDRVNHRLDKMNEVVKFTGNQRDELKVLFTDLAKRKKDAFCANEIGSDGMKTAMKAINKDRKSRMEKILTKDQMKLWKDFKKTQSQERKDQKGKSVRDNDQQER